MAKGTEANGAVDFGGLRKSLSALGSEFMEFEPGLRQSLERMARVQSRYPSGEFNIDVATPNKDVGKRFRGRIRCSANEGTLVAHSVEGWLEKFPRSKEAAKPARQLRKKEGAGSSPSRRGPGKTPKRGLFR